MEYNAKRWVVITSIIATSMYLQPRPIIHKPSRCLLWSCGGLLLREAYLFDVSKLWDPERRGRPWLDLCCSL